MQTTTAAVDDDDDGAGFVFGVGGRNRVLYKGYVLQNHAVLASFLLNQADRHRHASRELLLGHFKVAQSLSIHF